MSTDTTERLAYAARRVRHLDSFPAEGLTAKQAKERRDLSEALTLWRGVLAESAAS